MFAVIIELVIEIAIIIWASLAVSDGRFWWHVGFCLLVFVGAIILAVVRSEDRMDPSTGQRRYFMTIAHATVWAFFIGILLL